MQDIVIENLCKSFEEKKVICNFSAVFPAGKITCLMAPSGYGKTTLLRIVMGLEKADSGSVKGMEDLRISAVFQEDRLCENLSAAANIRLVNKKLSRQEAESALRQAGIEDCANQPVREFSGGMKRRVALVRALMAEYDVLILDEPFKGLDEEMKARMIACALQRSKGHTVLLVTHEVEEARMMQAQIVKMDEVQETPKG